MRLVTVAHGTRHASGNAVAARLTELAGRRLGVTAVASYVELCEPSLESVLSGSRSRPWWCPLLLSSGHHVRCDLPASLVRRPVRCGSATRSGRTRCSPRRRPRACGRPAPPRVSRW